MLAPITFRNDVSKIIQLLFFLVILNVRIQNWAKEWACARRIDVKVLFVCKRLLLSLFEVMSLDDFAISYLQMQIFLNGEEQNA